MNKRFILAMAVSLPFTWFDNLWVPDNTPFFMIFHLLLAVSYGYLAGYWACLPLREGKKEFYVRKKAGFK